MEFKIEVNGNRIKVMEGESLLHALQSNGFKIPTLCHMNRFSPTGACRLCVVEVEGKRDLVTSCSQAVEPDMKVQTNSKRVMRARKALVELLLSGHPDDCLYCQRNGNCELQWLAQEMNVKERKYFGEKSKAFPDYSSPGVARDPAKCVLCGRCVRMCEEVQLVTAIDFISRGNETSVNSAFLNGLNVTSCIHCGQCVQVCPTAALLDNSHIEKVQAALGNSKKQSIFMISPAAVASIAEAAGIRPRHSVMGRIVAALKRCGASRVFDLGVAGDLNILMEAAELTRRLENKTGGPFLSSCCPSWVRYIEEFSPEMKENLLPVKSPQQVMGSLIKTMFSRNEQMKQEDIFTVAVMPCVANKYEAAREENTHKGISEVDAVLTVREFFSLLRSFGLDLHQMGEEDVDKPFVSSSSAAWKMGYSGGKAEAVAREVFRTMSKQKGASFKFGLPKNLAGKRETKVEIGNQEVGFAWVSSIREAAEYLQMLGDEGRTDIHYVEVMACLDGCAGGGGQPISRGFERTKARKKYSQDMEKHLGSTEAGDHPVTGAFFFDGRLFSEDEQLSEWISGFRKSNRKGEENG